MLTEAQDQRRDSATMRLSRIGQKMSGMSGLRTIMEDIAASTAAGSSNWLNLSVGNPALIDEVVDTWRELTVQAATADFTATSSRYGPSRGLPALVDAIVDHFNTSYGWDITADNVVVGPGSQMLCFMAAALFTGSTGTEQPQRLVLPMTPDYAGYQGLSLDRDGVIGFTPRVLLSGDRSFHYAFDFDALDQCREAGMFLLSSPSNPTGRSVDGDELARLLSAARQRDVPLFVDHAYGEPFPRIAASRVAPQQDDYLINCFTLSKAGLPAERIGFAIGPDRYIRPMVSFMANSALHAPQLMQLVAARSLTTGALEKLASSVIAPFYQARRRSVERLLAELLPASVNWRLHTSEGGMFCWLWVDEPWFDDMALYELMKTKKVFIVPGRHFFVPPSADAALNSHGTRCFRISLSADEGTIGEGIARIAEGLTQLSRAHHA
ncbi:aminotransferase class I/II-fold pyridoxal phosphate-dependent enzyme [Streptomyces sp. NPDC014734]|uniref:aminotransferase class I/II-fold pyridoxal phosphate-dependent enzyme n=1 Tax=Streptomyces sp. NPDC014734 TaxID=3364886 RepID=UPI0036F75630